MSLTEFEYRDTAVLAKDLCFAFELKKYSIGEKQLVQVRSLNREGRADEGLLAVCQFIQMKYCKYKKAPLWSLKYCNSVDNLNDKEKQAFCTFINHLTELISCGYNKEIVHNINLLLRMYLYDFTYICRCLGYNNLLEGFRNYILLDSTAQILEEELNDVVMYIKENNHTPIYLMSETEISKCIKEYRVPCLRPIIIEYENANS